MKKTAKFFELRKLHADSIAYALAQQHWERLYHLKYDGLKWCMTKEQYNERRRIDFHLMKYCQAKSIELGLKYLEEMEIHNIDEEILGTAQKEEKTHEKDSPIL